MKKVFKFLLYTFIFFIVAFIILLISLPFIQGDWIEPVPGVSLELKRKPLKKEDIKPNSAMSHLLEIEKIYDETIKDSELYKAEQTQDWINDMNFNQSQIDHYKSLLELAKQAFVHVEKSLEDPAPQVLEPPSMEKFDERNYIGHSYKVNRLLILKIQMLLEQGKFEEAVHLWKVIIRHMLTLSRGGDVYASLCTIGITSSVMDEIRKGVFSYELPEKLVKELMVFFEGLEGDLEPLAEIYKAESISINKTIDELFDGTLTEDEGVTNSELQSMKKFGYFLGSTRESVKENMNDCMTHLVHISNQEYRVGLSDEFSEKLFGEAPLIKLAKNRDPLGYMFASMFLPVLDMIIVKNMTFKMEIRSTQLFLAINLYSKKHGKVPNELKELVPVFIKNLPLDPFNKKELKFKSIDKEKWMIYSVYKNTIDDGAKLNYKEYDREYFETIIRNDDYIIMNKALGKKKDEGYYEEVPLTHEETHGRAPQE